ncbi:MAG: ABC transporter ATP-binding protein [Hyphomicrobiales bacterium]|nr:ABC transporter ATP-binding protein [Hyphomicrobiales bacterium]
MADAVLSLDGLRKSFGGLTVTDDVSLAIAPGELHALIGPNGAGKTTLINQISGLLPPDAGRILFEGTDITRWPAHLRARHGLARSFQITSVLPGFSALENVAAAVQAHLPGSLRCVGNAARMPAFNEPARAALAEVGLAGRTDTLAGHLSHGEKRALELAMVLAARPRLILLDEPMAGTGRQETERLVDLLRELKGRFAMILVEHDMTAVFALADRISVLVYGRILMSDVPDRVRADPQVAAAYLGDEQATLEHD